jgi:hypothetical protein
VERAKVAMPRSISPASRTLTGFTSTLSDCAMAWMMPNSAGPVGTSELRSTATRLTLGAICLSSSNHFPPMLYSPEVNPVTLPPGRAMLSTKPAPTGSAAYVNTIGTVRVACNNGPITLPPPMARITSGASTANSAADLRMLSTSPEPQR